MCSARPDTRGQRGLEALPHFWAPSHGHLGISHDVDKNGGSFLTSLKGRGEARGSASGGRWGEGNRLSDYYLLLGSSSLPGGDERPSEVGSGADCWGHRTPATDSNDSSQASKGLLASSQICAKASFFVCTDVEWDGREEGRFRASFSTKSAAAPAPYGFQAGNHGFCGSRGSLARPHCLRKDCTSQWEGLGNKTASQIFKQCFLLQKETWVQINVEKYCS